MTTSKLVGMLGVGVLWIVAASCGEPFAFVGAGGGGAGGGSGGATTMTMTLTSGQACDPTRRAPCAAGLYCKTDDCKTGSCQPVPLALGGKFLPVCGCDSVAYWNSSLAVEDGVSFLPLGAAACTQAVLTKCTKGDGKCDQDKNHFCARETAETQCASPDSVTGSCMRGPDKCEETTATGGKCPDAVSNCSLVCDLIRGEEALRGRVCVP